MIFYAALDAFTNACVFCFIVWFFFFVHVECILLMCAGCGVDYVRIRRKSLACPSFSLELFC